MPVPQVKKGKWSKERDRTKSGRWRKKRSDADQQKPQRSARKYILAIAIIGAIIIVLIILYFRFPELFEWIKI